MGRSDWAKSGRSLCKRGSSERLPEERRWPLDVVEAVLLRGGPAQESSRRLIARGDSLSGATEGDPCAEPMEALAKEFDLFPITGTGRIRLLNAHQNMVEQFCSSSK